MTTTLPPLTAQGKVLDLSEAAFGEVRSSSDLLAQPEALRARLEEDGYLYLKGFFGSELIGDAHASLCQRLADSGQLHPDFPPEAAVMAPGGTSAVRPELVRDNAAIRKVVFGPELLGFYAALFGAPVRHFDHIWSRAIGRGAGTPPHCDIVYMGRGTPDLLTCWIPYADVPLEQGGLMVLEGSHRRTEQLASYLNRDVDTFCENHPKDAAEAQAGRWTWPGYLSNNPVSLREKLGGGRWLTAEWQAGDFITFKMSLVHGSLDNQTDRLRLSTDTRYQRASEPIDERWIGEKPVGHSAAGKRGRIC